ncbi:hypothetical protein AUP68_14097 [Ilyonectria robusta]
MSSSSSSRSSSPSRSFGSSTPTVAAPRSPRSASSPLDFFLQAVDNQETRGGADFLGAQSNVYDQIFRTFFDIGCDCKLLVPIPGNLIKYSPNSLCPGLHTHEQNESEQAHTLKERVAHLQRFLPPLADVFGENGSYDPRAYFPQWKRFLSSQPIEPLSFQKTQATLSQSSVTIMRQWDIDSIWLGARDLAAIRAPNDFRLSFLPHFSLNLSTDQVIQPHGLDLANTRHIPLGSFNTRSVRFSVFVFFPESSRDFRSMTSASSNALSLERQKDFYDKIIIPAAYETISDPSRQEIPRTFDIAYAKSRSYQEKPAMGRWSAEDENRSFRLAYTLPAQHLRRFWRLVVAKANELRVPTRRGEPIAYFQHPRLLFQAHDLKNTFARPSLHETLSYFEDTVLKDLNPGHLDTRSCWIDIGIRDIVTDTRSPDLGGGEPYTLLWKSQCNRHAHKRLLDIAPDAPLVATHFRSFLLRDTGTLTSKIKRTRSSNLGHPESRQLGIPRAKAYSSNKELFAVMFSNYALFSSGSLPLLAFDDERIQDLASMAQDRQRVYNRQLNRTSLLRAWEANKRHLRAISNPEALTNYGLRKEVTFRLDTVLTMWDRGLFDPDRNPQTGPLSLAVPLRPDADEHYPFWIVPTSDINALIFTQAARFILPLDHLFQEASLSPVDQLQDENPAETSIRQVLAFYTAQLFCRLLIFNFQSEREYNHDKWIWRPSWRVQVQQGVFNERRGLGLEEPIGSCGMLWIPGAQVDWRHGHLALETLTQLYISRSPLQARLASQANVQALTTTQITVEFFLQEWLQEARRAFDEGRDNEGRELADRVIKLSTEEIARAYNQHLLSKMHSYWERVRISLGRNTLSTLSRLRQAHEDSAAETSQVVTAQTIWQIYMEAWPLYSAALSDIVEDSDMPNELPCWKTTRKYLPPNDGWSEFVFRHLFGRDHPPKWNRIHFLQVYRTFKNFWSIISESAGTFDDHLKRRIGSCIMVTFNSDQTKEVGTNHARDTWYHGKPTFFQIQYWAPYFSPPQHNRHIRLGTSSLGQHHSEQLSSDMAPNVLTARDFQRTERKAHEDWLRVMIHTNELRSASQQIVNQHCRRALRNMILLAGPTWSRDKDRLDYIIPWKLEARRSRGPVEKDTFRVPIPPASALRDFPMRLSQPTILLPTRQNIMGLFDTIRSFQGLTPGLIQRLRWARRQLHNSAFLYLLRPCLIMSESQEVGNSHSGLLPSQTRKRLRPGTPPASDDANGGPAQPRSPNPSPPLIVYRMADTQQSDPIPDGALRQGQAEPITDGPLGAEQFTLDSIKAKLAKMDGCYPPERDQITYTAGHQLIRRFRSLIRGRSRVCTLCSFYEWGPIVGTHKLKYCSHRAESKDIAPWLDMFRYYQASGGGPGARCAHCRFPATLCWRTEYREKMDAKYGSEVEAREDHDILYSEARYTLRLNRNYGFIGDHSFYSRNVNPTAMQLYTMVSFLMFSRTSGNA